jgi:hypothetical protein
MSVMSRPNKLRQSQTGMVAIMVTLIMMIVISLIVLGFAQITRRAQRKALDAQLSSQAFYAAESGVNDAIAILNTKSGVLPDKKVCADNSDYQFNTLGYSNLGNGVSYSCVLVEPNPTDLTYKLGASEDAVIKLKPAGNPFSTLTFTWVPAPGQETQPVSTCPSTAGQYPVATVPGPWDCKFSVLRTELVPTSSLSRTNLQTQTRVNFFEPVRSGGSGSIGAAANAQTAGAKCKDAPTNTCTMTITGLGPGTYYMRVRTLYQPTTLTISATDAGGLPVGFADVQAQISVTGKAQDVLRRILVAVSLDGAQNGSPTAALISGDSICKRFSVTPTSFFTDDYVGGAGNPLCVSANIGSPGGGAADFVGCNLGSCGGGPIGGPPLVSWWGQFQNTSNNAPSMVASCEWNFDDAKYGGTQSIQTNKCYYGDLIDHFFTPNSYPGPYTTCRLYTVTLKVTLVDGTVKTKSQVIHMPGGSAVTCLTYI